MDLSVLSPSEWRGKVASLPGFPSNKRTTCTCRLCLVAPTTYTTITVEAVFEKNQLSRLSTMYHIGVVSKAEPPAIVRCKPIYPSLSCCKRRPLTHSHVALTVAKPSNSTASVNQAQSAIPRSPVTSTHIYIHTRLRVSHLIPRPLSLSLPHSPSERAPLLPLSPSQIRIFR